jgi:hypothetical protein
LHKAIIYGRKEIAQLLISNGFILKTAWNVLAAIFKIILFKQKKRPGSTAWPLLCVLLVATTKLFADRSTKNRAG